MAIKVMIIETSQKLAPSLRPLLEAADFAIEESDGRETAMSRLAAGDVPVVLINLESLAQSAVALIRDIRQAHPDVALITLNDSQHMDLSFQAMRLGVIDDLLVPLDLQQLIASIQRALSRKTQTKGKDTR